MNRLDTMMDLVTREAHEAELARRYPEAMFWYGVFSKQFVALVKDAHGTWRELAASDPFELADLLDAARTVFPDPLDTSKPLIRSVRAPRGRHARRR